MWIIPVAADMCVATANYPHISRSVKSVHVKTAVTAMAIQAAGKSVFYNHETPSPGQKEQHTLKTVSFIKFCF